MHQTFSQKYFFYTYEIINNDCIKEKIKTENYQFTYTPKYDRKYTEKNVVIAFKIKNNIFQIFKNLVVSFLWTIKKDSFHINVVPTLLNNKKETTIK